MSARPGQIRNVVRIGVITGSGTHALPGLEQSATRVARRRASASVDAQRGAARGRDRDSRLAPRRGPRTALEPRQPSREHRSARPERRRRDTRRHRVRRGRRHARARLADRLRRPALHLQPSARRLALLALRRARRTRPRPLGLRRALQRRAARGAARRRTRGGQRGARRRLLRPRRRPAVQLAQRDRVAARVRESPRSARPRARRPCSPARRELPYALLGYVTDYANGVTAEPTPVEELVRLLRASTATFDATLAATIGVLAARALARRRRRAPC